MHTIVASAKVCTQETWSTTRSLREHSMAGTPATPRRSDPDLLTSHALDALKEKTAYAARCRDAPLLADRLGQLSFLMRQSSLKVSFIFA